MLVQAAAQAPLPQTRLTWVFPPALSTGTNQEVTVAGADLDEPAGLQFSDPRIQSSLKPGTTTVFQVTVPAGVEPGACDVRVVGRFGASNPRSVWISPTREVVAPAVHANPATAMDLAVGTGVSGRAGANTASWFRVAAAEGTQLAVRVLASELDSRLDPVISLLDGGRHELARSARGTLSFSAPAGGVFWLRLNDATFRGGETYPYHLEVSAAPQIDFIIPGAVHRGSTGRVTVFGRNLPGGVASPLNGRDDMPLQQVAVELAATNSATLTNRGIGIRSPALALAGELFEWRLSSTNGPSNPVRVFESELEPVAAVDAAHGWVPQVISNAPPFEVHGLFPRRGESAGVLFTAHKGDVFWLDLSGERNGFPVDPMAVLQRITLDSSGLEKVEDLKEFGDSDNQFGGAEFNTASRDPAGRVEIGEDGTYRILVRDLFHAGARSSRLPYRLVLRRETPDFSLAAFPLPPPKSKADDRSIATATTVLRRGETLPVKVLAFRRDGFDGEISLTADGLPGGVTALPSRILSGQNSGLLFLTASTNAQGATLIGITGTAAVRGGNRSHPSAAATVIWPVPDTNDEPAVARGTRGLAVSVCSAEPVPVEVTVDDSKPLHVAVGGVLNVPLRVQRRGDFGGAFNLKPAGRPELDKAKEGVVAEKATNAVVEIRLADSKLPVGSHTLWLQGTLTGKYRNQPEAVAAADAALKAATEALAAAKPAEKPAAEERKKAAEAAQKTATERAAPRDAALAVFSRPFVVHVDAAPAPASPAPTATPAAK